MLARNWYYSSLSLKVYGIKTVLLGVTWFFVHIIPPPKEKERERKGGEVFILCTDNNIEFTCHFNEF